jgi:hypothetical protein
VTYSMRSTKRQREICRGQCHGLEIPWRCDEDLTERRGTTYFVSFHLQYRLRARDVLLAPAAFQNSPLGIPKRSLMAILQTLPN